MVLLTVCVKRALLGLKKFLKSSEYALMMRGYAHNRKTYTPHSLSSRKSVLTVFQTCCEA